MTWLIIWLIAVVFFSVVEIVTFQLVAIWFALGSVCSMVAYSLGAPLWVQLMVFGAVSLFLLLLTRPAVKKFLNIKHVRTNADRLIGKTAVVTEDICNVESRGAVKISGITWNARSEDGEDIKSGDHVIIKNIEGVKLIVSST